MKYQAICLWLIVLVEHQAETQGTALGVLNLMFRTILLFRNSYEINAVLLLRIINTLLRLEKDVTGLNGKLREHKKEIDDYDLQHIKNMIKYVGGILSDLEVESEETFIHLVDYHNQFNLSYNGKMHKYLKTLNFATCENILNFKLNQTKWGKEHPQDVKRRYNNIKRMS